MDPDDRDETSARRIVVVLNPAAGRGRGAASRKALRAALRSRRPDGAWAIVETTRAGDGVALARDACRSGADLVVAAGGDGTVREVLNGIDRTTCGLGVVPMGTGNDLARHLRLPRGVDAAVAVALGGAVRWVDVGAVCGALFVNAAGCGFDAVVAECVNARYRRLKGTAAYLAGVLSTLLAFRAAHVCIALDDVQLETSTMLCTVANSSSYGGGMLVAPSARLDDGRFDVCVVRETGRLEFAAAFPRVMRGTHVTHPKVSMYRSASVTIEADRPLPVLADGEVVGATPVTMTMEPRSLALRVPSGVDL